jgi:RNA-directed DNA polymerase
MVPQAVVTILTQSDEEDVRGFSDGVRPGRRPHPALDALSVALTRTRVNDVLDWDIRGGFDTLAQAWLIQFLQPRVADPRVLRLLQQGLRAGVSEEGQWSATTVGGPQGAGVSPLLANGYLHDVFELGVDAWRKRIAPGAMVVVRGADDVGRGFEHRRDAARFVAALRDRLQQLGLALQAEKTRLIACGPHAIVHRQPRGEGQPDTCDVLGFTPSCERHRKTGSGTVRRQTARQRMMAKLQAIQQQRRQRRHEATPQTGPWRTSVVQGYFHDQAVPGNRRTLGTFRRRVIRL